MVLVAQTTRAMAQQVSRVNARQRDDDLREDLRQAEEDLRVTSRQRDAFARRNSELVAENERLCARLAQLEHPTQISSFTVDGRPVMTQAQAAKWVDVSVATVSRYVTAGFWEATQQPGSNRWLIFSDQSLTKKRK